MLFLHQICFKLKFYTNVNILILTDKLGLFCLNILLHCVCMRVCERENFFNLWSVGGTVAF